MDQANQRGDGHGDGRRDLGGRSSRENGDRRGGRRDARGAGARGDRRDQRRIEAEHHTADVAARYAKEIDACAKDVRRVEGEQPAVQLKEPNVPQVTVVDEDAVTAILENGRGRAQFCDLAVLDFASFMFAGGGYIKGAWAQEEALCAESFLYNVLDAQKDWYAENRRRNLNCHLYRDRGLVVPRVRFTRGKIHAYADVLVVAAPNARRAHEEYKVKADVLGDAMRDRIRFALALADGLGHEKLVLGAFGCGAFGWEADVVAEMFRSELAAGGHVAKQVIFAVPQARFNENYQKFAHALATFPQKNAEPYEVAAAAAAAREQAAAEAAAADEADDEDWRKYL